MSALPRPDLPPGPTRALNDALHDLHHHAGWPSLRTLARETGVSHTTVSKTFSRPGLPTWGTLEVLVDAMDGDTDRFHDLWLAASAPASSDGPGPPTPQIAGRRAELDVVRRHLETGSGLLLVTGEAGIGKTRLVTAAVGAAEGFVATGRCLPLSTEVPLLPVADCLRGVHAVDAGAWLGAALASCPPYVIRTMAAVTPEVAPSTAPQPHGSGDDKQLMLIAVASLVRALARDRPVRLSLDDLHWADPATLDLLEYLLGGDTPVALVGTWRTDDDTTPDATREWLARVRRLPTTTEVPLGPLTEAETAEQLLLLGPLAGTASSEIHARSLGQPLFTEQLAAHHHDGPGLPDALAALLDRRLAGVRGDAWATLRVLGVAGRPLPAGLVSSMTSLAPDRLTEVLRQLQDRRLVQRGAGPVDLQHPLLGEAVQRRLVAGEGESVHRVLAQTLGARSDAEPGEVAEHWRHAGESEREIVWRLAAADAASACLDRRTEADQCLRAIEIWPRPDVAVGDPPVTLAEIYVRAMDALRFSFRYDEAAAISEVAERDVGEVDDGVRADLRLRRAIHRADAEGLEVGIELFDETIALCAGLPVRESYVRALDSKQNLLAAAGRYAEAHQVAVQQVAAATELDDRAILGDSLMRLGWHLGINGDQAEALELMSEAADRSGGADNPLGEIRRGVYATDVLLVCGAPIEQVVAAGSTALGVARRHHVDNPPAMVVRANVVTALLRGGRVTEADELLGISFEAPLDVDRWPLHMGAAMVASRRGHLVEAHALIETILDTLPESAILDPENLSCDADVAGWAGTHDRALRRGLDGLGQIAASSPVRHTAPVFVMSARLVADTGNDAATLRGLAIAAGLLDERHRDDAHLSAHRDAFEAELARAVQSDGVDQWLRAAARWDGLGRPHDAAYCRWRAAQCALRDGQGTAAAKLLKRAAADAREHVPLSRAIAGTAAG